MNPNSILNWLYHYSLQHLFDNDRRGMALALRVSERTLQSALEEEQSSEAALLFEQLLQYCMENDIQVDDILAKYKQRG